MVEDESTLQKKMRLRRLITLLKTGTENGMSSSPVTLLPLL